jgi:hypothetical protein
MARAAHAMRARLQPPHPHGVHHRVKPGRPRAEPRRRVLGCCDLWSFARRRPSGRARRPHPAGHREPATPIPEASPQDEREHGGDAVDRSRHPRVVGDVETDEIDQGGASATGSHSIAPDMTTNASRTPAYQPYTGVATSNASPSGSPPPALVHPGRCAATRAKRRRPGRRGNTELSNSSRLPLG